MFHGWTPTLVFACCYFRLQYLSPMPAQPGFRCPPVLRRLKGCVFRDIKLSSQVAHCTRPRAGHLRSEMLMADSFRYVGPACILTCKAMARSRNLVLARKPWPTSWSRTIQGICVRKSNVARYHAASPRLTNFSTAGWWTTSSAPFKALGSRRVRIARRNATIGRPAACLFFVHSYIRSAHAPENSIQVAFAIACVNFRYAKADMVMHILERTFRYHDMART